MIRYTIRYQDFDFLILMDEEKDQLKIYLDVFNLELLIEGRIFTLDNLPAFFNILDEAIINHNKEMEQQRLALMNNTGLDDIPF